MYYGNVPFSGFNPLQNQYASANGIGLLPTDQTHLTLQMNLLCQQMAHLTELVQTAVLQNRIGAPLAQNFAGGPANGFAGGFANNGGFANGFNGGFANGTAGFPRAIPSPVGTGYEHGSVQIRETESYICWQIPFQGLTLGDVEVEILGNRVICRTKAAVLPAYRFWQWSMLPQGVQFFELPDGRVESSCVIPVAFDCDEVQAVFKDGAISIYIAKIEGNQRHSVKIGKDTPQFATTAAGTRKVAEMRT